MSLVLKIIPLLLLSYYPTLSFGAYIIQDSRPVNCGVTHYYQGVAAGGLGTLIRKPFPIDANITPWSTWKSDKYGTQSWYGTGIIVSNIKVSGAPVVPALDYNSSSFPTGTAIGDTIVGFLQQWTDSGYNSSAMSIEFNESKAPILGFYLPAGNYTPGVYNGTVTYRAFSGVVGSDVNNGNNDYGNAFTWAINHAGTVCTDNLEIAISNSCTLQANDINYDSVSAVDIEKRQAIKQSDMSFSCLLDDSVKLTLTGDGVSGDDVIVNMGNNVVSSLYISKLGGDVVKNGSVIPVISTAGYLYKINSTLSQKDKSTPLTGGAIEGSAIIQIAFN
ncbi:hypothetical protein DCF83_03970 [Edwardsiella tarda]|uniref:hypothetical protein n=1 Tax=Edwardsiella tarda TaxID=636 RepID=UPI0011B1DAC0|nr:hypothetical protein [Edwardsiella tarda]UCQ28467.1 hypothetical protein DCF83_03970 [Edwardsiella tarda]